RLFIEETASDAIPKMASADPMPITRKVGFWRTRLPLLPQRDHGQAESLMSRATSQESTLNTKADRQKALKTAQQNARRAYQRYGRSRRGRQRGRGPDPAALRREVREAETTLRGTLAALARLMAEEPWQNLPPQAPL